MGKILQSTCLKPKYPLRRQLLVTFGSIAFLTIAIAVLLATITAQLAGQIVQDQARESLQDQVLNDIQVTSAYLADVVSRRLANLDGAAMIQYEIVRDRIVGYPDRGWENDTHVPFFDILTQRNVYPIQAPSPQRDWEAEGEFNLAEVPEILRDGVFDTSKAMFRFQGNCDPEKKNPSDKGYYPNCTMANNDVNTGGVVQPVASTQFLAEKAAAIGALQKPIWESHPEILSLNVAFYNSGAGACLCYPSFQVDATETYESEGCEWMLKTNPLTGEPYGSINETRRCHTKGNQVKQREYNPMEHDWCIDQALHPGEVRTAGPFLIHSSWVLAIGRAVFDRMYVFSGNFSRLSVSISCSQLNIFCFKERASS